MQVSTLQGKPKSVHLARILAVDAQHSTASSDASHRQDLGSSDMSPPAQASQQLAQTKQRQQSADEPQQAWEDDVAYLAPTLAFNMGLQHELWPFIPQTATSDMDQEHGTNRAQSMLQQQVSHQSSCNPAASSHVNVHIQRLKQHDVTRSVDVLQSGMPLWLIQTCHTCRANGTAAHSRSQIHCTTYLPLRPSCMMLQATVCF